MKSCVEPAEIEPFFFFPILFYLYTNKIWLKLRESKFEKKNKEKEIIKCIRQFYLLRIYSFTDTLK